MWFETTVLAALAVLPHVQVEASVRTSLFPLGPYPILWMGTLSFLS